MNILRHKSWHVRNRNNITRVRKDEEKAAQEEREKLRRVEIADSEARVHLLRQRLDKHKPDEEQLTEQNASNAHLDVFEDFGDKVTTKNKEHDKEAKEEKEKFEKKTGILQYLVDKEADAGQNWYLDSHEKRMKLADEDKDHNDSQKQFKDKQMKKLNDPLEDMKRYLEQMKPKNDKNSVKKKKSVISLKQEVKSDEKSQKSKSKKSKKHKKNKKRKHKRHSSESSESDDNRGTKMSKTIQQLRAERLEREKVERERTRALLYGTNEEKDSVIMDDRSRKYNSQFNPEIARHNTGPKKKDSNPFSAPLIGHSLRPSNPAIID